MKGAKGNSKQFVDEGHQTLLRPLVCGKAVRPRALSQTLQEDLPLFFP
jgi:hypothetical protein